MLCTYFAEKKLGLNGLSTHCPVNEAAHVAHITYLQRVFKPELLRKFVVSEK